MSIFQIKGFSTVSLGGYESQLRRHTQSNLNIVNDEEDYNRWIEHVNDEQYLKGD
jgi:hypothetical protein